MKKPKMKGRPSIKKLIEILNSNACTGKLDLVIILDIRNIMLENQQTSQENELIITILKLRWLIKKIPFDRNQLFIKIRLISNDGNVGRGESWDASTKSEANLLVNKLKTVKIESIIRNIDEDATLEAIVNATTILGQRFEIDAKKVGL